MGLNIKNTTFILAALTAVCLLCGCKDDGNGNGSETQAFLKITVKASQFGINVDLATWEDRVDELRMIAFRTEDGEVEFNQKLYFPDGFDLPSKTVQMDPGTYDFYFIANETVYPGSFAAALINISNVSEFSTNTAFTSLAYNPAFIPDGATPQGRFLMSAVYENITVVNGGSEASPLPFPIPGNRVELVRALAKIEVVFRKQTAGSSVPDNTITSVRLNNVAEDYSVPPEDTFYLGDTGYSNPADVSGLNYAADSIGAVTFYVPEFLVAAGGSLFTELEINDRSYPIETDAALAGLTAQRRSISGLSTNSVIRNYHYIANVNITSEGGVQIRVVVVPWSQDAYLYLFQGDQQVIIPPVVPTDSSIIITTECGKVEILSDNEYLGQGLYGAYHDQIDWSNQVIIRGQPPYYCEQKYGEGWRLINSCELLSFLGAFDLAYNIYMSNTWEAAGNNMPYYSRPFRQAAQLMLEKLTGKDLSATVLTNQNDHQDYIPDMKMDIVDDFFTPGDIMIKQEDYPDWPFPSPPGTGQNERWFYNEVTIQVKAFYYPGYVSYSVRDNWDEILYEEFVRYDYSSTVSRCVRLIE